jgi:hypothetical protein
VRRLSNRTKHVVKAFIWSASACLILGVLIHAVLSLRSFATTGVHAEPSHTFNVPRAQGVTIAFWSFKGGAKLHTQSFGAFYGIDPKKLWFTAEISEPVLLPPLGMVAYTGPKEYNLAVSFPRPPGPPGVYDVQLHVAKDFGHTQDGVALEWSRPEVSWPALMWWPDESNNDAALESLRRRFVGKSVYGYGGIHIECPGWFKVYYAQTPVRVKAVERYRGRLEALWTGSTTHWGDEAALHFFANDPIRFIVDLPSVKSVGEGGSSPAGPPEPCPSIELADWQVDVTISTGPPPALPEDVVKARRIRPGMSRDEVAWRLGYPNEVAEKSMLNTETTWHYQDALMDSFTVTFRGDKLASYTTAFGLPQ